MRLSAGASPHSAGLSAVVLVVHVRHSRQFRVCGFARCAGLSAPLRADRTSVKRRRWWLDCLPAFTTRHQYKRQKDCCFSISTCTSTSARVGLARKAQAQYREPAGPRASRRHS